MGESNIMKIVVILLLKQLYRINNTSLRSVLLKLIANIDGGQAFSTHARKLLENYHGIRIGIGTYGACFDMKQVFVGKGNLKIGKYCSFAPFVSIYTRNHPYSFPSTSPFFFNSSWGGVSEDTVQHHSLEIGNDVWIGQYSVILPSVSKIGDGAVVGAGSIVTKDVPDYAIVVGNPAHVIKYRFDDKTINRIKASKWWDRETTDLRQNIKDFQDIESFLLKEASYD